MIYNNINCKEKIFSIHLNSNNPEKFEKFCNSFIKNMENPHTLEILVHIDLNDNLMKQKIFEINSKYNNIKFIESALISNFNDAWKPLNLLLKQTSDSVKIIACLSDDIIMLTNKWDKILSKYQFKYVDEIFRIRCSKFKNEIYENIWECGFKPDFSFYSKKWLDIVGYWNPCIGPDTFQETVSFYLNLYGKNFNRSMIEEEIKFEGEETLTGLNLKQRIKRTKLGYKSFSKLISFKIQKQANIAAYKLASAIDKKITTSNDLNFYKLSILNLYKKSHFFHYRGTRSWLTSNFLFNVIFIVWCKLDFLDKFIEKTIIYLDNKNYLKKIITNNKQYNKLKEAIRNSESSS